ncbi:MAG: hypothetical protein ACI80V_002742 [Rhodothermales bacterium]|jgi:hypothetical protein
MSAVALPGESLTVMLLDRRRDGTQPLNVSAMGLSLASVLPDLRRGIESSPPSLNLNETP